MSTSPGAQDAEAHPRGSEVLIDNSRFVYSADEKLSFDLELYLQETAPHLLPHREHISHWSAYFTISPKVVLTLIELKTGSVTTSSPDTKNLHRPFGDLSPTKSFANQYKDVLDQLSQLFYLSPEGAFGLRVDSAADQALLQLLGSDSSAREMERFQEVYRTLFPAEKSLAEPADGLPAPTKALPPAGLLQLPYPVGKAWLHGATHANDGRPNGIQSALDFLHSFVPWGLGVSEHWVTAAHSGRVAVYSSCFMEVIGPQGWSTQYYHLENIIVNSGQSVNRNQRLSNYANTEAQALCNGGRSTTPHVHFALQKNGQFVSLKDVQLSNYQVQPGRRSYDTDCQFSWLERGSVRSCPFGFRLQNDGGLSLAAPRDLSADALSGSRIQLSWTYDPSRENGFEIERSQSNTFRTIATVAADARAYTDTNLTPGSYRYRVRAIGSVGPSGYSNVASATSGERAPSDLGAEVLSDSEIQLTWNDQSNAENGYQIEGKSGSGAFRSMANVGANVESIVLTELDPLTSYTFRVRATGGLGNSGYSNEVSALTFTDDPQPCVQDDQTSCLTQERFAVRVNWKNAEGETGTGHPVAGGNADSGMIWFFEQDNWEMLVKVLNGCNSNNRFWVFAGAATNVEYTLTITDTLTGHQVEYFKPLGPPAPTTKDTEAFATCTAG